MLSEKPYDETDQDIIYGMQEIMEVKRFTKSNFGGYWELAWLPVSGGMLDQPLELMEYIETIINIVNNQKYENDKRGGKK